jgi:hypothetical protein
MEQKKWPARLRTGHSSWVIWNYRLIAARFTARRLALRRRFVFFVWQLKQESHDLLAIPSGACINLLGVAVVAAWSDFRTFPITR